jgi:hypothetical protein
MRTVVREPGGLIGSADRRIDVRAFSGPDVTVSDLVLGSATGPLPVRATAFAEDGLSGMVETYGRAPDQLRALGVTATLVPSASNQPAATTDAVLTEVQPAGGGVTRRASFALPLKDIAPGPYLARVHVTAGNEPIADLTREVEVRAGTAPHVAPSDQTAFHPQDVLDGDYVSRAHQALRGANTPASVRALKGFDLFAKSDYAGAAAELSEALKMDQSSAAVAFVLGWAYEGAKDHRQAIGAWRAAATIDPKLVPAHLALADGYLRMSEPALAVQALRAGLVALPDSVELQAKLAQVNGKQ